MLKTKSIKDKVAKDHSWSNWQEVEDHNSDQIKAGMIDALIRAAYKKGLEDMNQATEMSLLSRGKNPRKILDEKLISNLNKYYGY